MGIEFYTSSQISQMTGLSTRQITHIIAKIEVSDDLLFKNKSGIWNIHQTLLPFFKKEENKKIKHFAFSTNLPKGLNEKEVSEVINYVISLCEDYTKLEYTIEHTKKDNSLHIHSILSTKHKRNFLKNMKLAFGSQSYKITTLVHRETWIKYITKEVKETTTIKNN